MPEIVKYLPFQSSAEPSFWMKLGEFKLNTLKLSEEPVALTASYGVTSTITHRTIEVVQTTVPGRMRLDQDSIPMNYGDDERQRSSSSIVLNAQNNEVHVRGRILILNTIESFKTMDKNKLLNQHCLETLMRACGVTMNAEEETFGSMDDEDIMLCETLNTFFCLCHLDLKQHKVVYWFAFPALVPKTGKSICYNHGNDAQVPLERLWDAHEMEAFQRAIYDFRIQMLDRVIGHVPFFMLLKKRTEGTLISLSPSFKKEF
jgi:ubiquitin-like modifier-activating enzyme ATG7